MHTSSPHECHDCDRPQFLVHRLDVAEEGTAAEVYRVGQRAYAVEAGLISFDGIPALRESMEEMRARPLYWLGAVTEDGHIAAFLAWQEAAGEDVVTLDRVCVDPEWFRRGLASRLLRHFLAEVPAGRDVLVSTGAENYPAVALYERLGFSRLGGYEPVEGLRLARFRLAGTSAQP